MNTKKILIIAGALIIFVVLITYFLASAKDKNNLVTETLVSQGKLF